jgi:predicted transcriptional regulator
MASSRFTVRLDETVMKRLETMAKRTGRSRSYLAGEAIAEYLAVNDWQIAAIKQAIASLDHDHGVLHQEVKNWVRSWDRPDESPAPHGARRWPERL